MNIQFVDGWTIVQTLGEGTFGEYVKSFMHLSIQFYSVLFIVDQFD